MNREELIHVVRASAAITKETRFIVVGSQAILGSREDLPEEMVRSMEADLYPAEDPEKAIEVDGGIGEGSMFQETFGYYAHGVGPETAKCPSGWESRLVILELETLAGEAVTAECLEPHDLILSKCAAGRERDWEFAAAAIRNGIVDRETLLARADDLPVEADKIATIKSMLNGLNARVWRSVRPSS